MSEPGLAFGAIVRPEHFADLCRSASEGISKPLLRPIGIVFISLIGALLAALWLLARYLPEYRSLAQLLLLSFFGGAMPMSMHTLAVSRAQQRGQFREGGSFLGMRYYTLDSEGARLDGAHGWVLTRWSIIGEMTKALTAHLLWTDPAAAVMVPKSAFHDEVERVAFIDFVKASLGKVGNVKAEG